MLTSKRREQIGQTLVDALGAGVTGDELTTLVNDVINNQQTVLPAERIVESVQGTDQPGLPPEIADELPIYTELPPGLIDLPTAASKYGVDRATLRERIRQGHLTLKGRLKAPAPGGGYLVVELAELLDLIENPPSSDPIYSELPPGLIDLPTASVHYEVNLRTLHSWVRNGHLAVHGRLKAPATGGGYVVVALDNLLGHIASISNSSQAESSNPVYSELPHGLIDLPTAAQKYGLNPATIRSWLSKGRIKSRGRLRAPATGGGYLVMAEDELIAYMSAPRLVGGRPRKQPVPR